MPKFKDMLLPGEIQMALEDLKFESPTEIQEAVIPIVAAEHDLIATAETGSGKTAGYSIPMLERLIRQPDKNALILAPTRELAHQIADFIRELTIHCKGFSTVSLVGGSDIRKQFRSLKGKPRIVVATPGRLTDHLKRKTISLDKTEILVLDEGDRMLDMGFMPQIEEIVKYLPKKRQTLLFSATMAPKVQALAEKTLQNPKKIKVGRISLPVESIKQTIAEVSFKEKDERIIDELNARNGSIIVFCRTKNRTDILLKILLSYGFKATVIHGGKTQGQRNKAIRDFKQGKARILCATDVAARGIDIPSVEHVINFDLPMMAEDYVHRIGRTARNGASGEALSFVMPDEHYAWNSLAKQYKIPNVVLLGKPRGGGGKPNRKRSGSVGRFSKDNNRGNDRRGPRGGFQRGERRDDDGSSSRSFSKGRNSKSSRDSQFFESHSKFKKKRFNDDKNQDRPGRNERPERSDRTQKDKYATKSKSRPSYGKSSSSALHKKKDREFDFEEQRKSSFRKDKTAKQFRDDLFRDDKTGKPSFRKKKKSSSQKVAKDVFGNTPLKKSSKRKGRGKGQSQGSSKGPQGKGPQKKSHFF